MVSNWMIGRILWITQFSLCRRIFFCPPPYYIVWNHPLFLQNFLGSWMSRDQYWFCFILCRKSIKNYPAQKLELLSPKNRYVSHQGGIWKINGICFRCVKKNIYMKSCLSAGGDQSWGENAIFQIPVKVVLHGKT